jgi:hypothetical protein
MALPGNSRKVILFIATSLDGYIARKNGATAPSHTSTHRNLRHAGVRSDSAWCRAGLPSSGFFFPRIHTNGHEWECAAADSRCHAEPCFPKARHPEPRADGSYPDTATIRVLACNACCPGFLSAVSFSSHESTHKWGECIGVDTLGVGTCLRHVLPVDSYAPSVICIPGNSCMPHTGHGGAVSLLPSSGLFLPTNPHEWTRMGMRCCGFTLSC